MELTLKITYAYESWLKNNPLDKLTVGKLTKMAKISRVSFYRSFHSIGDFTNWYLLKDFDFKPETKFTVIVDYIFVKVYKLIDQKRMIMKNIITSSLGTQVKDFLIKEIYNFQIANFKRIDIHQIVSTPEVHTQSMFYAHGLFNLILNYILLDSPQIKTVTYDAYIAISLRLFKGYVERCIERVKNHEYDQPILSSKL